MSSARQVAPLQNGELGGGEDALTHDLHDLSMSAVERNLMSDSSIEAEQRYVTFRRFIIKCINLH